MATVSVYHTSLAYFLAPIEEFLRDANVSEIMINGENVVYVERSGLIERTAAKYESAEDLLACVRNIAQYSGRRIDPHEPRFDGRLPDGSRVHVVLPPCARNGITVAIRKFSRFALTLDKLVSFGSLTPEVRELLEIAVTLDKNILVSGGTGSGKTQLLNALSAAIPAGSRVLVIEDTSELRLQQEHVVMLEARRADRHGRGEVSIRDLMHSALRLRPDRILVGECRGGEALDMVQAMNSGHAGSMTTVHANSPRDALVRVETLALMSNVEMPLVALRAQVASAIDLVVQTDRLVDGSRKVTCVAEVLPLDADGRHVVRNLATFVHDGRTADGAVRGSHRLGRERPGFWDEVHAKGLGGRLAHLRGAFDPTDH